MWWRGEGRGERGERGRGAYQQPNDMMIDVMAGMSLLESKSKPQKSVVSIYLRTENRSTKIKCTMRFIIENCIDAYYLRTIML